MQKVNSVSLKIPCSCPHDLNLHKMRYGRKIGGKGRTALNLLTQNQQEKLAFIKVSFC